MQSQLEISIINQDEWLRQEAARLAMYNILHVIYSYPDLNTINFLKDFFTSHESEDFISHLGFNVQNTFAHFKDTLDKDNSEVLEDLEVEYTRLFINSFNGIPAKPYESIYLDKRHLMIGETTLRVREFYRQFGVYLSNEYSEPPDHIAIETEFTAYLIIKEIESFKGDAIEKRDWFRDGQIKFLQQHLLCWAHNFSDLICIHSRHPFYHKTGLFSKDFFDFERKGFGL